MEGRIMLKNSYSATDFKCNDFFGGVLLCTTIQPKYKYCGFEKHPWVINVVQGLFHENAETYF